MKAQKSWLIGTVVMIVAIIAVAGTLFWKRQSGPEPTAMQIRVQELIEKGSLVEAQEYLKSIAPEIAKESASLAKIEYLYQRSWVDFLLMKAAPNYPEPLNTLMYLRMLKGQMAEIKRRIENEKHSGKEAAFLLVRSEQALLAMNELEQTRLSSAYKDETKLRVSGAGSSH